MTFSTDNPEGVETTPFRKICLGKLSGEQGLKLFRVTVANADIGSLKSLHTFLLPSYKLHQTWQTQLASKTQTVALTKFSHVN